MDAVTLSQCIAYLPPSQAVLIRGDHGIGKSDIVRTIAKSQKKELIDVRASTMQEGDVVGYPDLEKIKELGVSCFALPAWYVRACNEPCVLFLDELNRGLIGVLNGMFQVVLDRELGNGANGKPTRLHPETQVVAAVNIGSNYTVNEMDPALLSRFWVADFKPSNNDWIEWAKTSGVNSLIVEFIQNNPAHLRPTKEVEHGKKAPDQRAWSMLDRALKHNGIDLSTMGGNPPSNLYPIAMGFVGVEAAAALVDFVKNYDAVITAEDILTKWPLIGKKVAELSTEKKLAIIEKLKENVKTGGEFSKGELDNLVGFWGCLTGECKMNLYNAYLSSGNVKRLAPFHTKVGNEVMELITKANAKNQEAAKK